jgi:hypothetical protein
MLIGGVLAAQTKIDPSRLDLSVASGFGGKLHNVTNGTAAQDATTYSQSVQASINSSRGIYISKYFSITTAMKDDWSIIAVGIDSDDVIQSALDVGGNIYILDSLSIGEPLEIVNSGTHVYISEEVTLTASSDIVGVFLIDPDSEGHDINDIIIEGGHIACDNHADSAINVSGHYMDDSTGWVQIRDVFAQDAKVAAFCFNSTSLSSIKGCGSIDSAIGLYFMEGVINFVVDDFGSQTDVIGIQIGDKASATHARCEGIRISDSRAIGNDYNIKILALFGGYIDNCIFDFASHANALIVGNSANIHITASYFGNDAISETDVYGSCISIGDTLSGFDISHSDIINGYYYGVSIWSDSVGSTKNITIADNFMFGNGRKLTDGGDIQNYNGVNVNIHNNQLYSTKAANHYSYHGLIAADQTTFNENNLCGNTLFQDTNLIKVHNQGVAD